MYKIVISGGCLPELQVEQIRLKEKEMMIMEKKKGFSLLKFVIMLLCLIAVIASVIVNISFSNGKTPKYFGKYIYIVKETDNMGDSITAGAALIAPDASDVTIAKGDIVLCYPAAAPDELHVLSIFDIVTAEDGSSLFTTADASNIGSPEPITKDKIAAICTGHPQSRELGSFITFALGIKGILLLLVFPCVILLILLIAKIASAKNDVDFDDDEEFGFYEYDENEKKNDAEARKSHEKNSNAPLFEPSQEIQPSNELERKKMSIAENFSQKRVNPDSPYQKEKERTMQFKAQRSAESSFAARNVAASSSTAPTADALREEMLRKTAEAERTGTFSIKAAKNAEPVDNTGVLSKAQLAEMSRNDIPKTTPLRSQSAQNAYKPKKSSSPDISDIITKTESREKKKSVSDMSVDDLLQLIENEKNKL